MYDSNNNFRYLSKNHIKPGIKTRSNSKVKSTNCHGRNMSVIREHVQNLLDSAILLLKNDDSQQFALGLYMYAIEENGKALVAVECKGEHSMLFLLPRVKIH